MAGLGRTRGQMNGDNPRLDAETCPSFGSKEAPEEATANSLWGYISATDGAQSEIGGSHEPQARKKMFDRGGKMSLVERRLTTLWLRQTRTPFSPRAKIDQYTARMLVKLTAPLQIAGTVVPPGIYVLRTLDRGADCNLAEIFNEDETELVATFTTR